MSLEIELETYRKNLPSLLNRQGKFVLIQGDQIAGVLDSFEDALRTGYEKFGLECTFLVKEIQEKEKPQFFTRSVRQCRT